jgi:hypothetical protein
MAGGRATVDPLLDLGRPTGMPSAPLVDDVSLLDGLKLASPCSEKWEDMVGGERARFCGSCKKNVYNLSSMTRPEAEDLLRQLGDVCVRFYQRADGTIMTSDCPVGARRRRVRLAIYGAVGGSMLAGAAVVASAVEEARPPQVFMGAAPIPTQVAVDPPIPSVPVIPEAPAAPPVPHVEKLGEVPGHWLAGGIGVRNPPPRRYPSPAHCNCTPGDPLCSCL